jgi:hypothetical protein
MRTENVSVKNAEKNSLMSQEEFVTRVLNHYKTNDIIPGDPNEGRWQECHFPVPRSLGGTDTVLLLRDHHAVQGVLQSEEFETLCTHPSFTDCLVGTPYESLHRKWLGQYSRHAAAVAASAPPEERRRRALPGVRVMTERKKKRCRFTNLLTGETFDFDSFKEGCERFDLQRSLICAVAKGLRPHHKNFTATHI